MTDNATYGEDIQTQIVNKIERGLCPACGGTLRHEECLCCGWFLAVDGSYRMTMRECRHWPMEWDKDNVFKVKS